MNEIYLRFILNLPEEELRIERIGFNIEEAHWYYQDYIIEKDRSLPSLSEAQFSKHFFQFYPHLLRHRSYADFKRAYSNYRGDITVCGAILLNREMDEVVLVSSYNERAPCGHNNRFKFPRGKIDEGESAMGCAAREVWEEIGYPIDDKINENDVIKVKGKLILYIVRNVPKEAEFQTQTIREIGSIQWFKFSEIRGHGMNSSKFPEVYGVIEQLSKWIDRNKSLDAQFVHTLAVPAFVPNYREKDKVLKKCRIMGMLCNRLGSVK